MIINYGLGVARQVRDSLAALGDFAGFSLRVLRSIPYAVRRHPRETTAQFVEITLGRGALIVGGGTVAVTVLLALAGGSALGIEGYSGLSIVSLGPFEGAVAALANTRELVPLLTALALGSQIGCRFTAEIGSMRIAEEIDALEVMAIHPIDYVVAVRIAAILVAVLPLFFVSLILTYAATQESVVVLFHQSPGQYSHYFDTFIQGRDIWYSTIKIMVFTLVLGLIHTWFGLRVSGGGPAAVGEATGMAIRTSLVTIVVLDMFFTLLFYGSTTGVRFFG